MVYISLMMYLGKTTIFSPDTMQIIIFAGAFLLIGVSALTVLKMIMPAAELDYDQNGIYIFFERRSFIFLQKELFISYSNIANASFNADAAKHTFVSIKLRDPQKSIILYPQKKYSDQFESYWQELEKKFISYNAVNLQHPELLIRNKRFFEGKLMQFFAFISVLLAVLFTALKLFDPSSFSTWNLIAFYCYTIPFAAVVLQSNKNSIRHEK
jgi:hypothetical protein